MKRIIWQLIFVVFLALRVPAQTPLEFFTNQANAQLQAKFGFGVTNIPVYSTTNPAIGYSASPHYVLQSVANAYDATTPATNFPSVFRPVFSRQTNTLFIVGYTCVTTDFYAQISRGFKALTDPTITSNDNVWGIPWVVGAKGRIPAFNEYCYSTAVTAERQIQFVRYPLGNGLFASNRPPQYTNQFFIMSISNIFGVEAWNFYPTTFTNSVTLVISNQITVTITNNYEFGTNILFNVTTNWPIDSWPAGGFMIPLFENVISLPISYWSESIQQFLPLPYLNPTNLNTFLPSDLVQRAWPVHNWVLNITNNLMYALIDNGTGRVLDFVNLGAFGSSLNINQSLFDFAESSDPPFPNNNNVWSVAPADDESDSPMSEGMLNQIYMGMVGGSANVKFALSLLGVGNDYPSNIGIFSDPSTAAAYFIQSCSWQAANPMVHYTVADLANPEFNEDILNFPYNQNDWPYWIGTALADSMSGPVCSLGEVNPDYTCGAVENFGFNLSDNLFQIDFAGATNLPYQVWASTNLLDWCQIGTAAQSMPGEFQFQDAVATNDSARFYQVRLP